jgi:hypothetical protein
MTNETKAVAVKEVKAKTETKKAEAKKVLKKELPSYSFSQFKTALTKDNLKLSQVMTETGKTNGKKLSVSFSLRSILADFEKCKKIQDGKARRRAILHSASMIALFDAYYGKGNWNYSFPLRANVLRPIIKAVRENYKKDYNCLIQKSFQK